MKTLFPQTPAAGIAAIRRLVHEGKTFRVFQPTIPGTAWDGEREAVTVFLMRPVVGVGPRKPQGKREAERAFIAAWRRVKEQ